MSLAEYIGHFHPVLVHLPIGILLGAILFEWMSHRKGLRKLRKAVRWMLFFGFGASAMSVFTGFLLSQSGDYDQTTLNQHKWLGIAVTVVSMILFLVFGRKQREVRLGYSVLMIALALLILLTGHAGGTLTHGEGFLDPPPVSEWFEDRQAGVAWPEDIGKAEVYRDVISAVLKSKCVQCHGATRQKGKLRLDNPEGITKGGKGGAVIHHLNDSELLKRILADKGDEDHMPPRDKKQLTPAEVAVLTWWVRHGAPFNGLVSDVVGGDSIAAVISNDIIAPTVEEYEIVDEPDPEVIDRFRRAGVVVSFVSQENGLLSLNFLNADSSGISDLPISSLRDQTVALKLAGHNLSHEQWKSVGELTALRRLYLEHTNVSDEDLPLFDNIRNLEYINLVGTQVTRVGLERMKSHAATLKGLYLYGASIPREDQDVLRRLFPHAHIDFGNYPAVLLPGDTSVLKKPYEIGK